MMKNALLCLVVLVVSSSLAEARIFRPRAVSSVYSKTVVRSAAVGQCQMVRGRMVCK
jgi:hypothetical protein